MKNFPRCLIFRRLFVLIFVIGLFAFAVSTTNATVFPGTGVGAIPDGLTGTPPQYGASRVINFTVAGETAPIGTVSANVTLTHTWVGDIDMVLRSPGGTASHILVSRIGVQTAGGFGDSSNYSGLYRFFDVSALNIWTVATTGCADTCNVTPNTYRTTAPGQTGQTNPPPVTNLTAPFAGLTTAQINGIWTLTLRDGAASDTGTVTAANLTLITPSAASASISGRVATGGGRPISRARVTILNTATSETSTAYTSSFGYFVFEGLPVGNLYVLTVEHLKYEFSNNSQTFTLTEDLTGVEFTTSAP